MIFEINLKIILFCYMMINTGYCEQLCSCSILSFDETRSTYELILDLSPRLEINPMKSISDLTKCELDCRLELDSFFGSTIFTNVQIQNLDLNEIPEASNKICKLIDHKVSPPGVILFIQIRDINSQKFNKLLHLNRVCCQR